MNLPWGQHVTYPVAVVLQHNASREAGARVPRRDQGRDGVKGAAYQKQWLPRLRLKVSCVNLLGFEQPSCAREWHEGRYTFAKDSAPSDVGADERGHRGQVVRTQGGFTALDSL